MDDKSFRLRKGDGIAIFAPSWPATALTKSRYERGKKFLEDKGFTFICGNLTGKSDIYRSASIKERADELNSLIRNPEVKCIIAAIGGMNSNSILPYIDYEAFKNNPKIIIGYSDVTAILLGIYAITGITTFYGPAVVPSFGELPPYADETFKYFGDMFCEEIIFPYTYPTPDLWTDEYLDFETQDRAKIGKKNKLITVHEGKVIGRIIGGNLNTISGIWGSEYMPKIKEGDILFIEDCNKDISTVERSFSHLKINGIFDKVAGIILGKHELFNDLDTGRKPYEVLMEVIGNTSIPILAEFDCCHTHPMLTMPIGAQIELDATNKKVTLLKF
ncbi:MAG: peptidase S66 [Epulopiscium sp. Nele67-Bin004]|nr:MAG: peptidase S66 [Epulopiscium sp. Nele67-Bin004]